MDIADKIQMIIIVVGGFLIVLALLQKIGFLDFLLEKILSKSSTSTGEKGLTFE